jgi:predicted nuclease of predicted toxin-antitoxin system
MKLLVDNQLPAALAWFLSTHGIDCQHVLDIGLESASDQTIWNHARKEGLVIVTKDEDFAQLADRQMSIPPQVLWIRIGNCRKAVLLNAIADVLPQIRDQLQNGHAVVEVRSG